MGLFQGVAAARAALDPAAFADYMGLPLGDDGAVGFVLVYALRTGFIAALILIFCAQRRLVALKWMALIAIAIPVGDAALSLDAGAAAGTVRRHAAIAVFVLATFICLRRRTRAHPETA